jgi:hypothetical protein
MLFKMAAVNQVILAVLNKFYVSLTSAFVSYRCARIQLLERAFSHLLTQRRWGKNCLYVKTVEGAIHTEEICGDTQNMSVAKSRSSSVHTVPRGQS